jgi:hypothetical protein
MDKVAVGVFQLDRTGSVKWVQSCSCGFTYDLDS